MEAADKPGATHAVQRGSYLLKIEVDLDPFRLERQMALLLILVAAWYLRAMNAGYSSAYMDESVYVLYGRMFLARHFEAPIDQPLHWSFGWYLWPMMAAIADRLAGIVGVRELAALTGTATVAAVYGLARRVFSSAVGLASAAAYAVLAPAVYTSRIATRDSGSLFFLAVGLWLFARAWQEGRKLDWFAAAVILFAAFLCKYIVAIFFPFLVLLALRKKLQPLLWFSTPLTLLCAGYAAIYHNDLAALLAYGRAYGSLQAPKSLAWDIYFRKRLDFWIIAALSTLALLGKTPRKLLAVFWLGAAVFLAFQLKTRADYDYWKHAAYPLLFLTPLAMEGVLAAVARATTLNLLRQVAVSVLSVVMFCGVLGWSGNAWNMESFVFWPNVEPVLAFMEGRLNSSNRILVDDSVFRYYFHPQLQQHSIVDPFYFWYHGQMDGTAYSAAVHDGVFDYVLLDGGIGEDAQKMQSAIRPVIGDHYQLRFSMPDPQLGHPLQIYVRNDVPSLPATPSSTGVTINSPQSGGLIHTQDIATSVEGTTKGASPGWNIRLEVFTNRWYAQPEAQLHPDGTFSGTVYLGGDGNAQCHHLVRARLYDEHGNLRAADLAFDVARADPDGRTPSCK